MILILYTMALVIGTAPILLLSHRDVRLCRPAMAAQAVCRTYPGPRARHVVQAFGAMGTTLPWFGFATAQMMAD